MVRRMKQKTEKSESDFEDEIGTEKDKEDTDFSDPLFSVVYQSRTWTQAQHQTYFRENKVVGRGVNQSDVLAGRCV